MLFKVSDNGVSLFKDCRAHVQCYCYSSISSSLCQFVSCFCLLWQPFNATRINASAINNRVSELEKENGGQGIGKAGFWEEFEVCQLSRLFCLGFDTIIQELWIQCEQPCYSS